MLLYLRSHCFDDLRQDGSHVSQYGTGVDSQAAHSEYQSILLVFRAAHVPLRAPKSMDFSTGSTSEAFWSKSSGVLAHAISDRYEPNLRGLYTCSEPLFVDHQHDNKAKKAF